MAKIKKVGFFKLWDIILFEGTRCKITAFPTRTSVCLENLDIEKFTDKYNSFDFPDNARNTIAKAFLVNIWSTQKTTISKIKGSKIFINP